MNNTLVYVCACAGMYKHVPVCVHIRYTDVYAQVLLIAKDSILLFAVFLRLLHSLQLTIAKNRFTFCWFRLEHLSDNFVKAMVKEWRIEKSDFTRRIEYKVFSASTKTIEIISRNKKHDYA